MDWVLDSSLALAWTLPDENSARAERFLARVSPGDILWVPALWWYEISNALLMAQRRQRLAGSESMRAMQLYGLLPIQTDTELSLDAATRFQVLALEHALSAYDAAYLELAQRKRAGLATLDRRLVNAARRTRLRVLPA